MFLLSSPRYLLELKSLLTDFRTNETTTQVITGNISAWLYQKDPPHIQDIAPDDSATLVKAVQEQTNLG
jgi:hypothetical protein